MNPEKLRDTYGKLIYLLQDANSAAFAEDVEFVPVVPVRTVALRFTPPIHASDSRLRFTPPIHASYSHQVHAKLKECGALAVLHDDQVSLATQV